MSNNHNEIVKLLNPPSHQRFGVVEHYVYELYTADRTCLYVGRTARLGARFQQHQLKAWWREVARIEITVCPDYESASATEQATIKSLNPLHNEQFADGAAATRRANREARHAAGELCPPRLNCSYCHNQQPRSRRDEDTCQAINGTCRCDLHAEHESDHHCKHGWWKR